MIIPEELRVSIFLDTNLLIYLVDNSYKNLNTFVNYLVQSKFVDLSTSEYVLLEFINKRKTEHYLKELVYTHKINLVTAFNYHKAFNANEVDFNSLKKDIEKKVSDEVDTIRSKNIELEKHQLREGVFKLAKDITLMSKLTVYDSLVLGSSLEPYCEIILTNDKDFAHFYSEEKDLKKYLMGINNKEPKVIFTRDIQGNNLINNSISLEKREIEDIYKLTLIDEMVKKEQFLGKIFTQSCGSGDIVCFTLEANKTLKCDNYFIIVDKNLNAIYNSLNISEFQDENGNKVKLPFSSEKEEKLSFIWKVNDISSEKIKRNKNLVFRSPYV